MITSFAWFPYSLGSILLFGITMALFKRPVLRGENPRAVTFWNLVASAILPIAIFQGLHVPTSAAALYWAAVWGIGYAIISALQVYALSHVDTNSLFPITSTGALVLSLGYGLIFLGDHIRILQGIGILLTIATIYLFIYKGGKLEFSKTVLWLGSSIMLIGSLNKIAQKIALGYMDAPTFLIWTGIFGAVFLSLVLLAFDRENLVSKLKGGFKSGMLIGVISTAGGYLLARALIIGPFTLITALHSFYTVITALVAWMFFGEQLTKRKVFLIFLAVAAVLLIRLG